jgi:hypothetical protein
LPDIQYGSGLQKKNNIFLGNRHQKRTAGCYYDKLPMSNRDKKIPDKFQNVTGFTFTTVGGEMMIVFHGFYDDSDMPEFAEFVFSRIKMDFTNFGTMWDRPSPTIH